MKNIITFIALAFLFTSCAQTYYIGRFPQSHFTYPNANVTPMIRVAGKSNMRVKLFMPPSVTSAIVTEAYYDALSKSSGSDLLINIDAYHKITMIPVINLYFSKYTVEGTSAKQEVGKQALN